MTRGRHAAIGGKAAVSRPRTKPFPAAWALREAAQKSNAVLKELGPDIQWVESYVADDKTFCVYLAQNEEIIHEHSRRSGFPANKVTEVRRMIDPTTATEA